MKLIDIAFDLDGTLIHLMPVFERIIMEKYGVIVPNNRKFRIKTEPDIGYNKIKKGFAEAFKCIDEIQIAAGVRELFNKLYKLADEKDPIKIVTARPTTSANETYALVERICKNVDFEVIIVEHTDNKIKHLNRYDHFVDDRRKTALHLESYGKTVWVPIKNYNRPMPDRRGIMLINSIEDLVPWAAGFIKEM